MEQQVQESAAQGQTAAQAPSQPTQRTRVKAAAAPTKRTPARTTPNGHGAATGDAPSVTISLPKDCHDYFAAEAEKDERTLNQFLRRTLRDVWQQRTAQTQQADSASTPE